MYIKEQLADIEKAFIVFLPYGSTCIFFKEKDANNFALRASQDLDDPVFVYPVKSCDAINLAQNVYGFGNCINLVFVPRSSTLPSKVYNAPKKNHEEEESK